MPILLLMLLIFTCLEVWPEPYWDVPPGVCTFLAWGSMAAIVMVAGLIASRTRWALCRRPHQRETVVARYSSWRQAHLIALFATYLIALYLFGWGWAVEYFLSYEGVLVPGAELIILAPFLGGLVLSWVCFYDAERAFHDTLHPDLTADRPFWSRWAYVGFHVRQNLALVLVPVALLVLIQGLRRLYPDVYETDWFQLFAFALLIAMFLCLPLVLRLVLGLRSLAPGPLRNRLSAAGHRLEFRCTDILIWNTRQAVANAMVVGIVPWLRYVVLTDRLLLDLSPDEVEAVFGHEVGHVKHHHMAYYLGFLSISLAVLVGLWELATPSEQWSYQQWAGPTLAGSLLIYIFVVFGFLSRRCERQADIYGCRAVSCGRGECYLHDELSVARNQARGLCSTGIRTFIQALDKVADLNGISRSKPGWLQSWQHSTIARRVEFLHRMLVDPTVEPHFQRRVRIVKWVLMVGLCVALGFLSWNLKV